MSAETLRRAAALMRERAENARAGRWVATGSEVEAIWHDGPRYIGVCDGSLADGNVLNAEHIASWHPAVALAVADWLDRVARHSGQYSGVLTDDALTVARAYLGEQP